MVTLLIYYQDNPSILEKGQVSQAYDGQESWMELISKHLEAGELLKDKLQVHWMKIKSAMYNMIVAQLYRRSYSEPYLRCLNPKEAKYVLSKLHEGVCWNHLSGWTLAHQAHTQGYYWSIMHEDAQKLVRTCDSYQR